MTRTSTADTLIARILMDATNMDAYIQANYGSDPKMQKAMRRLYNRAKALDKAYSSSFEEWTYPIPIAKKAV